MNSPQSNEALQTQRKRWEHGHLELLRTVAPGLLWHSLAKRNWSALGFALDLAIPPLTLALFGLIVGFVLSALAAIDRPLAPSARPLHPHWLSFCGQPWPGLVA